MEEAALDALRNEKLVMGESVYKFEEEFARYIGVRHAISVNSGNSALQISLLALGISSGAKVMTSTNSFVASASCILAVNAEPILCDINEDGNIDISSANQRVDAIIPVHIYGNPCEFDAVREYSDNKIPIIEDACQAHGAIYREKKVGSLGEIGCFSFYPTKNMNVGGDGGMMTTNNDDLAKIVSSIRDNGRQSRYVHDRLGYTMRLNTINAAIGRIQLQFLDEWNNRRREIVRIYKKTLSSDCILKENPDGQAVYHQIVIKHKKRDVISKHLSDNNIGTMIHYPIPIHKQPLFSKFKFALPKSEEFCSHILSLPSHPLLKDEEVRIIAEKVNEVIV